MEKNGSKWIEKLNAIADRKIAYSFLVLTFFLRSLYSLYIHIKHPADLSGHLYYQLAQKILEQRSFFYHTTHSYHEFPGPVIAWINATTIFLFGDNNIGIYLVTSLASALITFFTYKVARLVFDKPTALLAGIWSLFYILYFKLTPNPGKDIWMTFFLILVFYLVLKLFRYEQFTFFRYLLFITTFVISFHLDERYFVFTPFLFLYILYLETDRLSVFRFKRSILFIAVVVILTIPWTVRNYFQHDKIVIISTRTEAFTDRVLGYEYTGHSSDEFTDIKGRYYIADSQIDAVISGEMRVTDGGYEIPDVQIEAMKRGLLPKPLTGFRAFFSRIKQMLEPLQLRGEFVRTGYFFYKKSLQHNIASLISYGVMFFFSIPGFYFLFKKDRHLFFLFLLPIIIYVVIHGLFIPYTNWRYRIPLDSLFIIVGSHGVVVLFGYLKSRTDRGYRRRFKSNKHKV